MTKQTNNRPQFNFFYQVQKQQKETPSISITQQEFQIKSQQLHKITKIYPALNNTYILQFPHKIVHIDNQSRILNILQQKNQSIIMLNDCIINSFFTQIKDDKLVTNITQWNLQKQQIIHIQHIHQDIQNQIKIFTFYQTGKFCICQIKHQQVLQKYLEQQKLKYNCSVIKTRDIVVVDSFKLTYYNHPLQKQGNTTKQISYQCSQQQKKRHSDVKKLNNHSKIGLVSTKEMCDEFIIKQIDLKNFNWKSHTIKLNLNNKIFLQRWMMDVYQYNDNNYYLKIQTKYDSSKYYFMLLDKKVKQDLCQSNQVFQQIFSVSWNCFDNKHRLLVSDSFPHAIQFTHSFREIQNFAPKIIDFSLSKLKKYSQTLKNRCQLHKFSIYFVDSETGQVLTSQKQLLKKTQCMPEYLPSQIYQIKIQNNKINLTCFKSTQRKYHFNTKMLSSFYTIEFMEPTQVIPDEDLLYEIAALIE